jgi:hypothetical protein
MQKYYVAIILAILFFFFILTAIRAWRARAAKQEADFTQPPMALGDAGKQLVKVRAFYVATTFADNHLERVRAYGLGIRGLAHAIVFEGGLQLIRKGERNRKVGDRVTFNQSSHDRPRHRSQGHLDYRLGTGIHKVFDTPSCCRPRRSSSPDFSA